MNQILTPYAAGRATSRLRLSSDYKRSLQAIVDLLGEDGRANVETIHQTLHPLVSTGSANKALRRLVDRVNAAAGTEAVALEMCVTATKSGGASGRWVWFEGPDAPAPTPSVGELDAIPAGRVVDQYGVDTTAPTAVLLTFNKNETRAVMDRFCPGGRPRSERRSGVEYNQLATVGGFRILHAVSGQGQRNAQAAAELAWRDWNPDVIVGVGIAFGIDERKQKIGDVLVAEALWGYELGRVEPNGMITPRDIPQPTSVELCQRLMELDHRRTGDHNWPTLHFGSVLSGDKLVDNLDYRDSLAALANRCVGGEMEGLGLGLVCAREKIDGIVIKGICDWGDGDKNNAAKEYHQRVAAQNAAQVVWEILVEGPLTSLSSTRPARRPPTSMRSAGRIPVVDTFAGQFDEFTRDGQPLHDSQAATMSLAKDAPASAHVGTSVQTAMVEWISDPAGPPMFALLGEYGMGKTVNCQQFTKSLLEKRVDDPTLPIPLYFDLKHLGTLSAAESLRTTVESVMRDAWFPREFPDYNWDAFLGWLRQGAVVIFDGLDEVLVKMDQAEGHNFTQRLLGVRNLLDEDSPPVRVVLSCRTQYFPTLRAQRNHFTGRESGKIPDSDYRAFTLLPLTEQQIRQYLAAALPDMDVDELMDLVHAVHNLSELAQRPYSLRVISEQIPALERLRAEGKPVHGVTLYGLMVEQWLDRDDGKHRIRRQHKLELMGHLAAYLWREGLSGLPAGQLQDWFHEWRESAPRLRGAYSSVSSEQLEEDLRTATFLARVDDSRGSTYRFAHTSLQEYFLACALLDAVEQDRPSLWAIKTPSREMLEFFTQLVAEKSDPALLTTMGQWRHHEDTRVTALLLRVSLIAHAAGLPTPRLEGIRLVGAQLDDLVIDGLGRSGSHLSLANADFTRSSLRRAQIGRVDLSRALFTDTCLAQATFVDAELSSAAWTEADTSGTTWWKPTSEVCASDSQFRWTTGHNGPVRGCAFSPDCTRLASAGSDGTVRLWDPQSGEIMRVLRGHTGPVRGCVFSPDGRCLASAGDDGTVQLWDLGNGETIRVLRGHTGPVRGCVFSPDGRCLASAGDDGTVQLWDLGNGETIRVLRGHTGPVRGCVFSPDGRCLASAGDDGTVQLWDLGNGETIRVLRGHTGPVRGCVFSPDGRCLASAGDDGTVRLWDPQSEEIARVLRGHDGWVRGCVLSPDGARLASAGDDGTVRLWDWDPGSGETIRVLRGHNGPVRGCVLSPDGARLASAGDDGTVRLWDPQSGEIARVLRGHDGWVWGCVFSPDGRRLASAGDDGTVRLWDPQSGEIARVLRGHDGWVWGCVFSPDGRRLASAGDDGTVRLWDPQSGEIAHILRGHNGPVLGCVFSPDGRRLASAGGDGTVRLWDPQSGEIAHILRGHNGWVRGCAFSPDGTRLASAGHDGTVQLWDPQSGEIAHILRGHNGPVRGCAFSPDGRRLASAGDDGTVRLWDPQSGEIAHILRGHNGWVRGCAFSPDGARLASAGDDGTVRLWDWDPGSGEIVRVLRGHDGWVGGCVFSPDGARLASAGRDGTVRLWESASGREIRGIGVTNRDAFGIDGWATWTPKDGLRGSGAAWRCIRLVNDDGSLRRPEWPGLSYELPA